MSWSTLSLTAKVFCWSIFSSCHFFMLSEFMLHPLLVLLSNSTLRAWAQLDGPYPLHRSPRCLWVHFGVIRREKFWLAGLGKGWGKCRRTGKRVPTFFALLSEFLWIFLQQKLIQRKILAGFKCTYCWPKALLQFLCHKFAKSLWKIETFVKQVWPYLPSSFFWRCVISIFLFFYFVWLRFCWIHAYLDLGATSNENSMWPNYCPFYDFVSVINYILFLYW